MESAHCEQRAQPQVAEQRNSKLMDVDGPVTAVALLPAMLAH